MLDTRDDLIALGDATYLSASGSYSDGPRTILLGIVAVLVPLAMIAAIEPSGLRNPAAVLRFELFCLAFLMLVRGAHRLLMPGTCVAALFDQANETLEVVRDGVFGTTTMSVRFDEIESLRLARGEWQAESASAAPIAVLRSRGAIALPQCDPETLAEIRFRMGLR